MSGNHPRHKEDGRSISPSEMGQHSRRSKSKVLRTSDPNTDISSQLPSSTSSSPVPRSRTRDRRDSHTPRRSRRRSRSPPTSKSPSQDPRADSPESKRPIRGLKRGLVALGGVLAAGLPIAGELYLKHLAHEHEREKDERKEVRHEQAMEEKERKRMDLELQATEEEADWMSRKHGIDIRRREVELQIREMERDGLMAERSLDVASRVDEIPTARRIRMDAEGMDIASRLADEAPPPRRTLREKRELIPYQPSDEPPMPQRNTGVILEGAQDRLLLDYQQSAQPRSRQLRSRLPIEDDTSPPSQRLRRERSASPPRRHALPTTTALLAGSLTAYRVRRADGPWRKKALRVATSAGTAALASLSFEGAREDGRVAEGAWGVAVPVMAGIGAERIFWGKER